MLFYLVLFLFCLIPEAVYLPKLGFFWDDWSILFQHIKFGDSSFWEYFSYNRPLSAWTYIISFPIGGESPLRWHLILIVLRWCLCILFYRILRMLLPENKRICITAAILYAVCPLFSQYYISTAYTQHFIDHLLYAASVLLMLKAITAGTGKEKAVRFVFSVVLTAAHLTISEYFAFPELIKIPLCYLMVTQTENDRKKAFGKTVRYSLVYLLIFVCYCLYRYNISGFFPNFSAETPDLLFIFLKSPAEAVRLLLKHFSVNFLYPFTGFIARLFDFDLQVFLTKPEIASILISLAAGGAAMVWIKKTAPASSNRRNLPLAAVCLAGLTAGFLPFVIMNENCLNNDDLYHADRTYLAAYPYVCLIFAYILSRLFSDRRSFSAAFAFLVFLFCHYQMNEYYNAVLFTRSQNSLYQQLAERMPGIKDDTAIVDDTIIFPQQGNFATASAINVLYPNQITGSGHVPFWVFSYNQREYEDHGGFTVQNRNYIFRQPRENYIYIDHDNKFANCAWVFSPEDTDNPHVTDLQKGWIAHTDPSRILTGAEFTPDPVIFGKTADNWCMYYQKASLLRQQGAWNELGDLAREVLAGGFSPSDSRSNSPFEWWPFIEGLYRTGDTETAASLAEQAVRVDAAYADFYEGRLTGLASEQ